MIRFLQAYAFLPVFHNNDVPKAEAFNAYFSTVFTVDDGSDVSVLRRSLSFHPSIIQSIEFNVEEVYNELRTLNCGKACGPDLLPSCLLKLSWVLSLLLLR